MRAFITLCLGLILSGCAIASQGAAPTGAGTPIVAAVTLRPAVVLPSTASDLPDQATASPDLSQPSSGPVVTPKPTPKATPKPTPKPTPRPTPKPTKKPSSGYYKPAGWDGYSDVNCSDFDTHTHAQSFFRGTGGSTSNDPYGLDADNDGIACESLPG